MDHKNKPEKELYTVLEEKIQNLVRQKEELALRIKKLEKSLTKLFEKYELIEEKTAASKIKFDVAVLANFEEWAAEMERIIQLTKEQYEHTEQILKEYQIKLEKAREEGLQDLIERIEILQEKIQINRLKLPDLEHLNKEIDEIYKRIEKIK
ncbi:MAG: hypothetical protein HWN67_19405 [Candidatus Helarchaeota archaeon]|nr:hypothetical protein [Candidatus Helarchaeota archaeon]